MLALLIRPRYWGGHLAMLLCLGAALGLGVWQLDAWHIHRQDAARNISATKPVPLGSLMGGDSPFPGRSVGQPVTFSGTWMGSSTLYVSDRYRGSKLGYWVVTPVIVDGTRSAMPLVRGWSPRASTPIPSGHVTVTGWLQPSEGLGPVDPNPNDRIIPMMRIASIVQMVPEDLYSGFVIANVAHSALGSSQDGVLSLDGSLPPSVSSFTGLRNFLYGIEWWFFGGFAVFVWVRWCRDSFEIANEADAGPDADGEPEE